MLRLFGPKNKCEEASCDTLTSVSIDNFARLTVD